MSASVPTFAKGAKVGHPPVSLGGSKVWQMPWKEWQLLAELRCTQINQIPATMINPVLTVKRSDSSQRWSRLRIRIATTSDRNSNRRRRILQVKKAWTVLKYTVTGTAAGIWLGWLLSLSSGDIFVILVIASLGTLVGVILGIVHRNDP